MYARNPKSNVGKRLNTCKLINDEQIRTIYQQETERKIKHLNDNNENSQTNLKNVMKETAI